MRSRLPVGLIALVALVVLAGQASAQLTPDWDARHKGVDGFFFGFNVPVHMVTDSAGAVYVSSTFGPGLHTRDILTVKYAPDGTELWSVVYDGSSSDMDTGVDITMDSAGDLLVLGRSECGFLVIKYAPSDGAVIWTSQHDGGNCPEKGEAIATDDVGNIYVTGTTRPPGGDHQWDFYTYKMDSGGNVLWTATYDGPGYFLFGDDIAVDVAIDSNGDVLVTGPSNDQNAQSNFVTIKYRGTDGAQLWLARLDIPGLESVALLIDSQDDVYVTGAGVYGHTPFVTAKYAGANGSELWRSINSMGSWGRAFGMAFDSQGDVYVTGRLDPDSNKSTWNENVVTMRLRASDGTRKWLALYGDSTKGRYDEGLAIAIDAQDNVWVTGSTTSFGEYGLLLLKYDAANGQLVDHGAFPVPNEGARGQFIGLDSAQNIIVTGTTRGAGGLMDILTLKYPSQVVIGTNYCGPATLNSSGQPAVITATGSDVAAQNQMTLTASQLPTNKFGYFLNSDVQGFTPLPPGSEGNLCLGGGIGRHVKQIGNSGNAGKLVMQVDLTALPRPNGSHTVLVGEIWNFQAWFRDVNPGVTSNFTDAVSVTFL